MSTNTPAKATVGLKKLVVWPVEKNTETELLYGEAHEFVKQLMAVSHTPTIVEGSLAADDDFAEEEYENQGGELTFDITSLTSEERVLIYGETVVKGTNVTSTTDRPGAVAVAYMTERTDGKYNLVKYLYAKFSEQSESKSTKKRGEKKYDTLQIKGKYHAPLKSAQTRYTRLGVDPLTDAAVIEDWFTEADYIGPDEGTTTQTTSTDTGEDG